MNISLNITEVAIFSLDRFTFGVDTNQIQEIVMVKHPMLIGETDPSCPFFVVQYHQQPLPVFDFRQRFCLSSEPKNVFQYPVITFPSAHILAACWVTAIEDIQPVSLRSLQPVPSLLTNIARQNHLWGFYEISGTLIPLLDLEHVISSEDIDLYSIFLSKFSLSHVVKAEK